MPITDAYTLLGAWPDAEVDLSVEALAAAMQARSVNRALLTHTSAIFYDQTLGNDQVLALAKQHAPLVPVAVINPLVYPACVAEIERCLEAGVRVFRLCPREHRYPMSGHVGPLREVFRRLEPASLILADLADLPAPVLTTDVEDLLPGPTAFTVSGLGLGTLLQAAHGGPHVWVETSRLDAGGAVEAAVQHLGAERVVFGSGAPLRSLGSAVMSVQYADIDEAARSAIFEGNVQRLLS
jgi:predicted TIM-barrel fold metal-dependent hydrolase